jgi:geranylgeranylglycerol-phosphate geranylgeranyltransferase
MKNVVPTREASITAMSFRFIKAYVKSMRLYYAFLTGIAGWTGVSFYLFTTENLHYTGQIAPSPCKTGLILFFLFCVWGSKKLAAALQGCRSNVIGEEGCIPSPMATVETPAVRKGFQPSRRPEGRGSNRS